MNETILLKKKFYFFSRSVLRDVGVVDMSFTGVKLYFLLDNRELHYLDGSAKRLVTTFREQPDSVQVIVKGNLTDYIYYFWRIEVRLRSSNFSSIFHQSPIKPVLSQRVTSC